MAAYTPDARSKGIRLSKRTTYDQELVHGILNEVPILHVSFNAPPNDDMPQFPTILPMLGAVGTYKADEDAHIYLHGSSVARLFKLTNGGEIPLCVAGTLIDGYVLALAPFHNSCNYRSAVAFGLGTLLEDPAEIEYALILITNNAIPQRWENSRSQATNAELTSTGILKVRIETASAKVRNGGPSDDRADLKDDALTAKTWTGVVPAYMTLGEPIAGESNKVKQLPEYLDDWVADVNSLNEQKAVNAVDPTEE
ncbi:flavin-nucleotide-binding protein [Acrodontium crateriforme]|uniref:Flavin-nucleotide-binding protein n=1 Tax=Acrodontium crateriforme TaxID=150365 RepID=A0AAQ3M8C6_9PEZI|nr:flavin-nucleotide-binding protein [Acrodontium crateriforme]